MPELKIQSKLVRKDVCVLSLEGFLDAHTFEQLDTTISDLFEKGIYKVVADLKGVEYISSAGAGVFIGSLATAQESGGNIILLSPTPNVREVFDLLGLSQIFTILDNADEAMKAVELGSV